MVSSAGDWFLLRLLPFMSEAGACEGVVLSLVDITRLKTTEAVLQAERRFWQSILNTFDMQIAILNDAGQILHVNKAWRDCAKAKQGETNASYTGLTYMDVYRDVFGVDANVTEQVAQGLSAVLTGTRSAFTIAYLCPSTKRESLMRAIGFASHGPARTIVMHEVITDVARERG